MAVSPGYLTFVLEQLGRVFPVTDRRMFGGVGLYAEGVFFALIADDRLYFKVDDTNRPAFEAAGMGPFRPYGDDRAMAYFEVPVTVLEDVDVLREWAGAAVAVAQRAAARKR